MKLVVFGAILLGYFFQVNTELAFKKVFTDLHQLSTPSKISSNSTVETRWIEQKVDNFNILDTRTWNMRYMQNKAHFQKDGPIFIFVGGEWEIDPGFIEAGHMFDIAKELNGYLFYTEHRYYGKSHPMPDLSVDNLKYLNVDQALADLANFIRTIKTIPELKDSKVILTGASYSATMVTWFRRLYPELSAGAWASSAPLLAKINFREYKEITGQSITIVGGQMCHNRIRWAFQEIEQLLEEEKFDELKEIVHSCDLDFTDELNVWSMFSSISGIFGGLVQAHNDGDIDDACKRIMAEETNLAGVSAFLKPYFGKECFEYSYKKTVEVLRNITYNGVMRQWIYQTCTEYGWFPTSAAKDQPFGTKLTVDLYYKMCEDIYDERYTKNYIHENAIKTNFQFGGLFPAATNVFSTQGELDPWRVIGKQTLVVPLYGHCKDLASLDENKDSFSMILLKKNVREQIHEWLGIKK